MISSTSEILPLDNNTRAQEPPKTTAQLTKKQKNAIAVADQKELNLAEISSANKTILSYNDVMVMVTSSDVKPFIKAIITNTSNDNIFRIGSYVDLQSDFSRECNRPVTCEFLEKLNANYVYVR